MLIAPSVCFSNFAMAPFTNMEITLIKAWISNHIRYKVWDEITYPFLNFNGYAVKV